MEKSYDEGHKEGFKKGYERGKQRAYDEFLKSLKETAEKLGIIK